MYMIIKELGCDVAIHLEGLQRIGDAIHALQKSYERAVIISDDSVYSLFGDMIHNSLKDIGLEDNHVLLNPGEESKTIGSATLCWEKMHEWGLNRHSLVIALGGGVVGDLANFVASCYMRGIDCIQVPTTLMAMVDSAIGGKTGVNLPSGKNIVGTFQQPKLTFIALDTLQHLPEREMSNGLAEIIKYGVIRDATFFDQLERLVPRLLAKDKEVLENVIGRCCKIKLDIVHQDEKDQGLRSLLNFGHTFGHALETATHYNMYAHGQAVAIGMSCAGYLSIALGLTTLDNVKRIEALCHQAKLPTILPENVNDETLLNVMRGDKKSSKGKIDCIVIRDIGHAERRVGVDEKVILQALATKRKGDRLG